MAIIATEGLRLSNLLKFEIFPEHAYCRKRVTVNEATAKDYVIGTVLGTVTADGKSKISVETAVDGSETPSAVVIEDISVAATTDTLVLVLYRGICGVGKSALVLDASFDDDAKKAAAYAALEALGIQVDNQV